MSPVGRLVVAGVLVAAGAACTSRMMSSSTSSGAGASASTSGASGASATSDAPALPASEAGAPARLQSSPRHGEYVMVQTGPNDSVRAYVVYPQRRTKAPVVVAVHDIYGLGSWIRGVADQLAADGFIAIAPDLITGSGLVTDSAVKAGGPAFVRALKREDVQRRISAVANYGMALPSAARKYGVMGFCWGGSTVFTHAVDAPNLGASVVYYGASPATAELVKVKAPVLGFYGAEDARVNSTIPAADSALEAQNKQYEQEIYAGAGHGFLRGQEGMNGANMAATQKAWPRTIAFFRQTIDR